MVEMLSQSKLLSISKYKGQELSWTIHFLNLSSFSIQTEYAYMQVLVPFNIMDHDL